MLPLGCQCKGGKQTAARYSRNTAVPRSINESCCFTPDRSHFHVGAEQLKQTLFQRPNTSARQLKIAWFSFLALKHIETLVYALGDPAKAGPVLRKPKRKRMHIIVGLIAQFLPEHSFRTKSKAKHEKVLHSDKNDG